MVISWLAPLLRGSSPDHGGSLSSNRNVRVLISNHTALSVHLRHQWDRHKPCLAGGCDARGDAASARPASGRPNPPAWACCSGVTPSRLHLVTLAAGPLIHLPLLLPLLLLLLPLLLLLLFLPLVLVLLQIKHRRPQHVRYDARQPPLPADRKRRRRAAREPPPPRGERGQARGRAGGRALRGGAGGARGRRQRDPLGSRQVKQRQLSRVCSWVVAVG